MGAVILPFRYFSVVCCGVMSINQSIKSSKRHTSTREATSQRNHTGSKHRDAKRRRLGGLRASRASVSLRDSLYVYTVFTEARKKMPRKTTSDVLSLRIFLRKKKEMIAIVARARARCEKGR